jgi:uncharacterized protein with HEPN domain
VSPRSSQERIRDILDAIAEIDRFVAGMTYEQFEADPKTIKAVIADLAVIGEAARHLPDDLLQQHPDIPWHLIRGMRNRLIHSYFEIEPQILWDTIRIDLEPLVDELRRLLS